MANFDEIRMNNRKQKRVRVSLSIAHSAYEHILQLSEIETEKNASQIVGDCIRFAYANGVYNNKYMVHPIYSTNGPDFNGPITSGQTLPKKRSVAMGKEEMCLRYGGRIEGATCYYQKYENTLTGGLIKSEQGLPLSQIPKKEEDFCKMVLGNFVSVAQAEVCYQAEKKQAEKVQVDTGNDDGERDLMKLKKK